MPAFDGDDTAKLVEFEAATKQRLNQLRKKVAYAEEFLGMVRGVL